MSSLLFTRRLCGAQIIAAAIGAAISLGAFEANAANTITFGANNNSCGGAVMCSTDGTRGYANNGSGQAFDLSTISQWFQIDVNGSSELSGQPTEPDKGAGSFLVLNDTGSAVSSFSLTITDDFTSSTASVHQCKGVQAGNICDNFAAHGGSGSYKFNTELSGTDWDRCTQGTTSGQTCTGGPGGVAADFAPNSVTYTWTGQNGSTIPAGSYFVISFSGWNNDGWATQPTTPPPSFTAEANMPIVNGGFQTAAIGGTVYAIGGNSPAGPQIGDTYAYDIATNQWKQLSSLPEGVGGTMAAAINGLIYVAGGATYPGVATNELFIYNTSADQWTTQSLPFQEGVNGCVAAINGELYVYNPYNNWTNQILNSLYVYNPATSTWTQLASPSFVHDAATCAVINGQLYLVSGVDTSANFTNASEVYNPATNLWASVAPIPVPVLNSGGAALNGILYVFGGCIVSDCSQGTNEVQAYDPNTNTWSSFATLPFSPPITGITATAAQNAIFLLGGVYVPGGGFNLVSLNTAFVP